jgi:hypothetical protein
MGGMSFWLHIYIFDRKMESILSELKKIYFRFLCIFNVLRVRAYVMCEGGSCEASLGTAQLSVWRRGCKALRFLILGARYGLTAWSVSKP